MKVKFYLYRQQVTDPKKIKAKAKANPPTVKNKREANIESDGIFAWVSYNNKRVRVSSGECINPKHWNAKQHQARESLIEHPEFNARLRQISSQINKTYFQYKIDHNGIEPEPAELKKLCDRALGRNVSKRKNFIQYFEDFIHRQKEGLRVNSKKGTIINPADAKHYQHTLNTIKEFMPAVDFKDIGLSFYNDFLQFLNKSAISLNTAGSHIKRLKVILNEAEASGFPVNPEFKSKYFAKLSEEAENIALTESELEEIQNLDLSKDIGLDLVRDLFVIGCNTGLRFSDFSTLKPSDISGNMIRITQQKTKGKVTIPVHVVVQKILDKYNGVLPASISNQKTNEKLKEIGKKVKLLEAKESKTTTKGGKKVTVVLHRWQMLSTHTARRAFATIQYNKGVPSITIMGITGHKTEKDFLNYIKVTPDEHALKIQDIWAAEQRAKMKAF